MCWVPLKPFWRFLGLSGTLWGLPGGYRGLCQGYLGPSPRVEPRRRRRRGPGEQREYPHLARGMPGIEVIID